MCISLPLAKTAYGKYVYYWWKRRPNCIKDMGFPWVHLSAFITYGDWDNKYKHLPKCFMHLPKCRILIFILFCLAICCSFCFVGKFAAVEFFFFWDRGTWCRAALDCDCDFTWVRTVTNGPACMTDFFENPGPLGRTPGSLTPMSTNPADLRMQGLFNFL